MLNILLLSAFYVAVRVAVRAAVAAAFCWRDLPHSNDDMVFF